MDGSLPPPPPRPGTVPPPGYGPPGYGQPPPYYSGYGAPPGWAYVAPTYATRLGRLPASFGERLGAYVIDALILLAVSIPIWIGGVWFVASNWEEELGSCVNRRGFEYTCDVATGGSIARLMLTILLGGVVMLVAAIFYWGKLEGERGQTVGKRTLGIEVVRQETGLPIGFGRAVGRMFARYLSSQVLYLGFLWMLWDDNKQTWHDKIVGSIVIKARQ